MLGASPTKGTPRNGGVGGTPRKGTPRRGAQGPTPRKGHGVTKGGVTKGGVTKGGVAAKAKVLKTRTLLHAGSRHLFRSGSWDAVEALMAAGRLSENEPASDRLVTKMALEELSSLSIEELTIAARHAAVVKLQSVARGNTKREQVRQMRAQAAAAKRKLAAAAMQEDKEGKGFVEHKGLVEHQVLQAFKVLQEAQVVF